jgi:WhiB family transcriptional regulator, redox-sensing transcriptional regulator
MTNHRQAQGLYDRLMELQRDAGSTPCQELPDVYYPEEYESPDQQDLAEKVAKQLCAECPIIKQCRQWGIVAAIPYGIIGGLTVQERLATPETIF